MTIQLGVTQDIDKLEALFDDLNDYLEENGNGAGWKKGIYPIREDAEKGILNDELFVLRVEGQIAGSITLNHNQEVAYSQVDWNVQADGNQVLVIRLLVVHPKFIRKGVSKELLEFAKEHARKLGCKSVRLDVANQNIPACNLYEKAGFKYVKTVDLGLPYEHLKWFRLYEFVI